LIRDWFLKAMSPGLLNEWQIEPEIWNYIRREIDDRSTPGQFILTGSAVPSDDISRHTGAGRLSRILMRPMTLFETGYSNGVISLRELLNGKFSGSDDPGLSVKDLAERVSVGGWPISLGLNVAQSLQSVRDYLEEIRRADISRVNQSKRDPGKVSQFLKSFARNVSTTVSAATIAADTRGADGTLHNETVREYLNALSRLMIVEDQPAWAPHLRSKSRLRKSPKRHFVDPSLAVAALRATPERLLKDINFFGLLFESLIIRDLRVFAQAFDASVYHYRDETDLEIDAIVETPDGKWGAFEIKLGTARVDEASENLLSLVAKIDTSRCGEPVVLGVITGSGYGYMRDDGIAVIPCGALGP